MGAIVAPAGESFELIVTLAAVDSDGKYIDRDKVFELDEGVTVYADAVTSAAALMADLVAISKCDIVTYRVSAVHRGDSGDVTAVGNPYKEGALTLNPDGGGDGISHTIYAPITAAISGTTLIETNAALLAYLDNFETTGDFRLSDGEAISTANQIRSTRIRSVNSGKVFG